MKRRWENDEVYDGIKSHIQVLCVNFNNFLISCDMDDDKIKKVLEQTRGDERNYCTDTVLMELWWRKCGSYIYII